MLKKMEAADLIKIQTSSGNNKIYTDYFKSSIPNYPWGILKSDIENAEISKTIKDDLVRAIQRIKVFIFQDLGAGASQDLKAAMQAVWSRNFGKTWSDPAKFFAGTSKGNFISVV
jgi:hypothetical protein